MPCVSLSLSLCRSRTLLAAAKGNVARQENCRRQHLVGSVKARDVTVARMRANEAGAHAHAAVSAESLQRMRGARGMSGTRPDTARADSRQRTANSS